LSIGAKPLSCFQNRKPADLYNIQTAGSL